MRASRTACRVLLLTAFLGPIGLGCSQPPEPGAEASSAAMSRQPAAEPITASPPVEPGSIENVVLITVDTLRADAPGFGGNDRVATPHLDRLASAGMVFDRAYAHNVVTLPSHANILTGLYPYQHGIRDNSGFILPEGIPTLATRLGEAGFATGAIVAAAPLDARYGLDRGFDHYDDRYPRGSNPTEFVMPERRGDEVVQQALEWWHDQAGPPRFLWVHLFDPHAPYLAEERFARRHVENPYDAEIEAVDAYLGPLIEELTRDPEGRTLVVFTADHGESLGDHGEISHGLFAYDATLRIPLVIWSANMSPQRSSDAVRHVDLLPTILDAVGVAAPAGLPGRSLLTAANEVGISSYFESLTPTFNQGWAPLRGVIKGNHKLIVLPIPELYDLASDAAEEQNLFDSDPELSRELAKLVPEESIWPPRRGEITSEEVEALEALGYLSGPARSKTSYGVEDDPKNLVHLDRKVHRVIDLYHQGQLAAALAIAEEVISERPEMGIAYSYLSQVLLEMNRRSDAIEVMLQARELDIASESLQRQLAMSLAEAGRYDQAVAVLEPYRDSQDVDFLRVLGLVLSESGRQQEAVQVLDRALALDPLEPVVHEQLALIALRSEQWEVARDRAQQATSINPQLDLSWNYLGTAQYNLGQPRQALESWDRAMTIDPMNFDVLFNISLVALEVGDHDGARRALESFIENAPPERYGRDIEGAKVRLRQLGG